MILVDTSVWIDHFRRDDPILSRLLLDRQVLAHPFVTGELALGSLRQRDIILGALRGLPRALVASDDDVQALVERYRLFGLGIGYIDAHLLAAARLSADTKLGSRDKRLRNAAIGLAVHATLEK